MMDRRRFLGGVAAVGMAGLAGCTQQFHRLRGVNIPISIAVSPEKAEPVEIQIEHQDTVVFDGTFQADTDGIVAVEGDDHRETEFETAGEYIITAETSEAREQETLEITWRQLADCKTYTFVIRVEDGNPQIGLMQTDQGCPPWDEL